MKVDAANAAVEAQPASTRYLYLITLVAAVGGFLFGYDLSLISGAIIFLKAEWSLSPFWMELITGSAILGCPFGPLAGISLADRFGRRSTLILSATLFLVSTVGSATAPGMAAFAVWRFVGGMGVGLASTVSPMYIAEMAPARLRGRLVVVNQLAIVIGLSLSVVVTYFFRLAGTGAGCSPPRASPRSRSRSGCSSYPKVLAGWRRSGGRPKRSECWRGSTAAPRRSGSSRTFRPNWAKRPAASASCCAPAFARRSRSASR